MNIEEIITTIITALREKTIDSLRENDCVIADVPKDDRDMVFEIVNKRLKPNPGVTVGAGFEKAIINDYIRIIWKVKMNWTHLRKQAIDPSTIAKWDAFLRKAGVKISEDDFDELEQFENGAIKVKTRSKPKKELILAEDERENHPKQAMEKLRNFLKEQAK